MGPPLVDDLDAYRSELRAWLGAHEADVARQRGFHSFEFHDVSERQRSFQAQLFDAGWVRYGWPEELGGLGGDARHRGSLYDALGVHSAPIPEAYYTLETLLPMLAEYSPELAREHLPSLLRGDEVWCQGFSEPDVGSDLASVRTRATRDGDGWVIRGHKIWTSQATVATRCVVLARTGTSESRHRGLSMFLVDHASPGVTVRPIRAMTGRDEFGEVVLDDVAVGVERLIGRENEGWGVAMFLLQWERGMYPYQRQSMLLALLDRLVGESGDALDAGDLADAYLAVLPMRISARNTIRRLAAHETPGPEVSVDKVLLGRAEVNVHDLAAVALRGALELDDDPDTLEWRQHYQYSRAAPIYGGSVEIQRTILADRVLGLPRG
jgi:alkylation response protein AidB-like acyl-CoA dehydrogenase